MLVLELILVIFLVISSEINTLSSYVPNSIGLSLTDIIDCKKWNGYERGRSYAPAHGNCPIRIKVFAADCLVIRNWFIVNNAKYPYCL